MRASLAALCLAGSVLGRAVLPQIPLGGPRATLPTIESLADLSAEHAIRLREHIASLPERRLVEVGPSDAERMWITEGEKALLTYEGIRFVDVTDAAVNFFEPTSVASNEPMPTSFRHSLADLEPLFANISMSRMRERLTKFSSFYTRYYRSSQGRDSQLWLLALVKDIAKSHPSAKIEVREFPHPWGQNSIILTIPRDNRSDAALLKKGKKPSESIVILGAHQDSTNMLPFLAAPGADDDGSGTTVLLETLSLLVADGFVPTTHEVQFHWYSAEEGGLLGSAAVAKAYAADGVRVRSMMQQDMTGYVKAGVPERIGIIEDFVDLKLTAFVEQLVNEYTGIKAIRTKCGYGCSDHASWTSVGAPSAFAIENSFADSNTGGIHSTRDTIDAPGFSFDHMARFVRLDLAYIKEVAA